MSYDLTGQKVSFTYGRVVQVVSGSYYDGYGNLLPIGTASISGSMSGFATTGSNIFIGDQTITGSIFVTNAITGSLNGTASYSNNSLYSETASYYNGSVISSSYSLTASYAGFAETTNTAQNSQNAQDILVYVKNTTGNVIPKGKLVRIVGVDNNSNNPTIALADFINDANSANTLGYTNEVFSVNGFGYVITEGKLTGVDTSNFTSGDLLFLSSSGQYTNVKPIPPYHGVRIGQVIRSQSNNGSIYVTIDNGVELDELHNVIDTTTTSSYGDLLIKSGSVWTNSRNLTGSYILSGSLSTNGGFDSISITASNISASNITGSVYGTCSIAINSLTASYITSSNVIGTVTSASYSLSSSYAPTNITASWSNNSLTASSLITTNNYTLNTLSASTVGISSDLTVGSISRFNGQVRVTGVLSASAGITASAVRINQSLLVLQTATFSSSIVGVGSATFGGLSVSSNAFFNNGIVLFSNGLTASAIRSNTSINASSYTSSTSGVGFLGTSSWSNNSITASDALSAQSASYVLSSNIAGTVTSASYSLSASFAPTDTNITASWATNTLTASSINFTPNNANTASYILATNVFGTVTSASYSLSSSYSTLAENVNLPIDPQFVWSGGKITRINYASGIYKTFTYDANNVLTQSDYVRGSITTRKIFTYNIDGTLNYITQSQF